MWRRHSCNFSLPIIDSIYVIYAHAAYMKIAVDSTTALPHKLIP